MPWKRALDGSFVPDPAVTIAPHPSPGLLTGFAELSPASPAHRPTMTRMLQSITPPVGFALVEEAGRPPAFALGMVEGGHSASSALCRAQLRDGPQLPVSRAAAA